MKAELASPQSQSPVQSRPGDKVIRVSRRHHRKLSGLMNALASLFHLGRSPETK